MTSLTDKMAKLRKDDDIFGESQIDPREFARMKLYNQTYTEGVNDCIALVKAEAAVVGDWEAEFENLNAINYNLFSAGTVQRNDTGADWTYEQALSEIKTFITHLLAAKDREREEAYKKGFIDGGLSK